MQNYTRYKLNIWTLAGLFALFCAFICSLNLFRDNYPLYYSVLPSMPFVCSIMFFISSMCLKNDQTNIAVVLIIATALVRYCVLPIFLVFSNFATAMKLNIEKNATGAIILLIYEIIAVFLTVIIVQKKQTTKIINQTNRSGVRFKLLGEILAVLLLFCLFVLVYIPQTKLMFKTIFDLTNEDFTSVTYSASMNELGSTKRILQTLFAMVFHFLRIMVPIYVVKLAKTKKARESVIFLIAFVFVFLQFLLITSTFAESIISGLIILIVTAKICPEKGSRLLKFSAVFVCAIVIIYFCVRYWVNTTKLNTSYYTKDGNFFSYLSNIINAYFTGVDNVAAVFNVPQNGKLEALFFNVYRAIPFNNSLFGLDGENFQSIYNSANNLTGQIQPTIASGYYFFGPIFAPILSVLITWVALTFANKGQKTQYFWEYVAYTFTAISIALGLSMYNDAIVLQWFTTWELPIIILSKLSSEKINDVIR